MAKREATRERVLLADDEPISRDFLGEALTALGVEVVSVADGDAAVSVLEQRAVDLVFTDLQMPKRNGLAVLAAAKAQDRDRPVVLVTAHGSMGVAIEALRAGADDILEKPVALADLELALLRARAKRRLLRENRFLRSQSVGDELFVAGPQTAALVELATRAAASDAPVLVTGESGTGKERVAALVHRRSPRADGPYVKVNCAAVPDALLESEFFGHEAGAFTGAQKRRVGLFELADGGTLFLDEVGEMALPLQAKLLRVLQDGEFMRVGGSETVHVDVRVVCATNRDLRADVELGRFRADLLYRLCVVPLQVSPLRARRDEIAPLARHFLAGRAELGAEAVGLLEAHDWPGNVRELQNVLQRALVLGAGRVDAATMAAALDHGRPGRVVLTPAGSAVDALVGRTLAEVEAELLAATLARCGGNRTQTAKTLGIGVRTLFNKLQDA